MIAVRPALVSAGIAGALVAGVLSGCARDATDAPQLVVVGTVDDDSIVVTVPALTPVSVDLDAGLPTTSAPPVGADDEPAAPVSTGPGGFSSVATVTVRDGSTVRAGEVVAVLDHAQQGARLTAAEAAAATARAVVGVVQAHLDQAGRAESSLLGTRATVERALRTLAARNVQLRQARAVLTRRAGQVTAARARLVVGLAAAARQRTALVATLAELVRQRSTLEAVLAQLPADDPSRPVVVAEISFLSARIGVVGAAIAQVDAGAAKAEADLAQIERAVAVVEVALATTRRGLAAIAQAAAKARAALARIGAAVASLGDAQRLLRDRRRQADIAVGTAEIGVAAAREQLALTTVRAPLDGVVVAVAADGDVLAPGAPLVRIRPGGRARAATWLAPDQLAQVCIGGTAHLHGDWMSAAESEPATVSRVGTAWEYPPSSQATDEIHLTRTAEVEVTADAGSFPTGVPVEITFDACPASRPIPAAAGLPLEYPVPRTR